MSSSQIKIPKAFKFLFEPMRYKVAYGGRGSGKTWAFAQALLIKAVQQRTLVLCTREYQGSILDSVHRVLAKQIELMKLDSFFEIQKTTIIGQNGSEFIFEGLKNNVTKIKSFEGVDVCWTEEAESITENSWDILLPTIRKPKSEIWISFNPRDEQDNTYQRFVSKPPKDSLVRKVNWDSNPFFPAELKQEMEECKERDYQKYLHIWTGECYNDYEDSVIQPEWVEAAIDAHKKLNFQPMGRKVLGFDPADRGKDAKAIVIRYGSVVTKAKQWTDGGIEEAIEKAFDYAYDERCTDLVYDGVGVGTAVKVGLDKRTSGKGINVISFIGSNEPAMKNEKYNGETLNRDMFRNRRAQYWWLLRDRFYKTYRAVIHQEYTNPEELISLSSDIIDLTILKSELSKVQRKRSLTYDMIQIQSKQEMESSPNLADSLVYSFANYVPYQHKIAPQVLQIQTASGWS